MDVHNSYFPIRSLQYHYHVVCGIYRISGRSSQRARVEKYTYVSQSSLCRPGFKFNLSQQSSQDQPDCSRDIRRPARYIWPLLHQLIYALRTMAYVH
jgi:hypothetical protein